MDSHGRFPEVPHIARQAASRLKLQRVKAAVSRFAIFLAAVLTLWSIALRFKPAWITPLPWSAAGALALLMLIVLQRWYQRTEPGKVLHEMDRRLGLPDVALSAGELPGEDDGWIARLRRHAQERTSTVNWREAWPVPWPKWTPFSASICAVLLTLLCLQYRTEGETRRILAAQPAPRDPRAVALEEVFRDWDQAKENDEELRRMMEKIAPLRERLTAARGTEKEQFAAMVRLEEVVAAEKAKLEEQSLEPQAANLAAALQPMEGMGALAASLRKKDFDRATELAGQAADRLANQTEIPKGAREAGNAAQQLAQKFGQNGQQGMCEGLNQFSQGTKESDRGKMSKGMTSISQGLCKQAARRTECKRLSTQLAQLSFCKNPGNCNSAGMCFMPKIGLSKSNQPSKGAGSETNLNRFGAETQLASERRQETMNNIATDGESETTTLKAAEGQAEALRVTRSTSFQDYRKLSQQAIADESLPVAHREAIKRYFEKIRPDSSN